MIFLLLLSNVSFSQILIKVNFKNNSFEGHGIEMYYTINNIQTLDSLLCKLKVNNERKFLNSFGLPISEFADGNCIEKDNYFTDVEELLKSDKSYKMQYLSNNYDLAIFIVKAKYNVCTYDLKFSGWGSYNGNFRKAGIIIEKPVFYEFSESEHKIINKIEKRITKLF